MSNCEVISLQELVREQLIRAPCDLPCVGVCQRSAVCADVPLVSPLLPADRNSSRIRSRKCFSVSTRILSACALPSPSLSFPYQHRRGSPANVSLRSRVTAQPCKVTRALSVTCQWCSWCALLTQRVVVDPASVCARSAPTSHSKAQCSVSSRTRRTAVWFAISPADEACRRCCRLRWASDCVCASGWCRLASHGHLQPRPGPCATAGGGPPAVRPHLRALRCTSSALHPAAPLRSVPGPAQAVLASKHAHSVT